MTSLKIASPEAVVTRASGFMEAEVDGEIVALDIEKGICYGLNNVGSRIWRLIAAPARIGDICATLVSEYAVDPDVCESQVLDLFEDLHAEGLVTVHMKLETPSAER